MLDMDDAITRYRAASQANDIVRPWLALTLFALVLGPKVARRPAAVWRAFKPA